MKTSEWEDENERKEKRDPLRQGLNGSVMIYKSKLLSLFFTFTFQCVFVCRLLLLFAAV